MFVRSNNASPITGTYPHDVWFKVTWLIDLDNNKWELIVDGQCLGFFTNNWNTVASLNLYPSSSNNQAVYFVDDVSYSHDPNGLAPVGLDAGISGLSIKPKTIAGTELDIMGSIQNSGNDEINSFKIEFSDGSNSFEKEYTGLIIGSGLSYQFDTDETYTAEDGIHNVTMSLLEVNGQTDERDCNDVKTAQVTGVTPAPYKNVLLEEATGTWCTWCPRGDVFVNWMLRDYPDYVVAIGVHGGSLASDPMTDVGHINFVRNIVPGFAGYPNMLIERKEWFGFGVLGDVESRFFDNIGITADAWMEIGAKYDAGSRQLEVSTGVNYIGGNGGNYSIDVILIENNITKDSAGYAQVNQYSGGGRGPMGGYENLPNPVPARDMSYQHVTRGSFTNFNGKDLSGYVSGDRPIANFTKKVNAYHDVDELHLIAIFSNSDGTVNNVTEVSLQEAIDNGFEESTLSSEDIVAVQAAEVYPNPANAKTFVKMTLEVSTEVQIKVVNQMGQTVAHKEYGELQGEYVFPVDLGNMPAGTYNIMIQAGDQFKTKKLQVIK